VNTIDDILDTEFPALVTDMATVLSRLSALRAGYLDNLSAGAVALQSSVDDLEGRLTAGRAAALDNLDVLLSSRAAPGDAMDLAVDSIDSVSVAATGANEIRDAVFAQTLDGLTVAQILGVVVAALAGKASGMDTTTGIFRNIGDTLARITATVDANGNRTAITLDLTGL
jgi:hypothetical protein